MWMVCVRAANTLLYIFFGECADVMEVYVYLWREKEVNTHLNV